MKRTICRISALSCLISSCLFSCRLISYTDTITLLQPLTGLPFPGYDFPERWHIRWLGVNGGVENRTIESADLDGLHLEIPRERALVILAEPLGEASLAPFVCKPAAVLLDPGEVRPSRVRISWENGFAASVLLDLAEQGVAPEIFNLKRFARLCSSRSNGNPWNLDRGRLVVDMLSGDLRVYSFRCREQLETELELPLSGFWYPEYPLSSPINPVSGCWSGVLSIGFHRFSRGPSGPTAEISIDNRGRATVFVTDQVSP